MFSRFFSFFFLFLFSCHGNHTEQKSKTSPSLKQVKKDSPTYPQFLSSIDSTRLIFQKIYSTNSTKALLLSKKYLIQLIGNDLYSYWKGTPWDFNGATTTPQKGKIACGYFVTTLLKDAGVNLNRFKLAVCPSLSMMKELTSSKSITNLSSLSYSQFTNCLNEYGEAVFVIGLDYHTGFIVNDGKGCWFIHSNYIYKIGVIKEKISESYALQSSKTRYVTSLTDNEKFLKNWLLN